MKRLTLEQEAQRLEGVIEALLDIAEQGTVAQLAAIVRLRQQQGEPQLVALEPFDLPAGYVQVTFETGFTCGISRAGEVSS